MANAGKNAVGLRIPDDPKELEEKYRISVKRILRRKTPMREIARKIKGISHTTIQNIFNDPDRPTSRKTMMKIVRYVNPASPKKKKVHIPFASCAGLHYPDAK